MNFWMVVVVCGLVSAGMGCSTSKPVTLRFHEQANTALPATRVRFVETGELGRLPINPFPTLTERDVVRAQIVETMPGAVMLQFSPHGTLALNELTTRARGQHVVVLVDEEPVMVWRIDRRLTDGQFLLRTDLPADRLRALVDYLNHLARPRP